MGWSNGNWNQLWCNVCFHVGTRDWRGGRLCTWWWFQPQERRWARRCRRRCSTRVTAPGRQTHPSARCTLNAKMNHNQTACASTLLNINLHIVSLDTALVTKLFRAGDKPPHLSRFRAIPGGRIHPPLRESGQCGHQKPQKYMRHPQLMRHNSAPEASEHLGGCPITVPSHA